METGKKQPKKSFAILLLILVVSLVYTSYGADTKPPHPIVPATWRFFPAPAGPTSITMQASPCYDSDDPNTPPVWYYYQCTTTGHTDINSGWIQGDSNVAYDANTIWTATGLDPNTSYSFKYRARDSADPCNMTNWSPAKSARTDKATTPPVLRLDLNASTDNSTINTRPGFTPFILSNNGSSIGGVIVDLVGDIQSKRNIDPCGTWAGTEPNQEYYQRAGENIYQDFIYGINPSGVTITLWGLGTNRDCNLTIWAYDACSTEDGDRVAHWYSNGTYIFDTNFIGGSASWPRYEAQYPNDFYKWAWSKRVTADAFGRVILTSSKAPSSPEDQDFAFVNALIVEPNGTFVPTPYATRPQPIDEQEDVNVATLLKWTNGSGVSKHDLYLGDDFDDVNNATRASHPDVPIYAPDLAAEANQGYDPFDATGFLKLNTTYYWRVDENTPPNLYEGEVWSFKALPFCYVDDFNSYVTSDALRRVWKDYWYQSPQTRAEVFIASDPTLGGPPYQSMEYKFLNATSPYYAEVNATIGTGTYDLKIDPNWGGMNAKALTLYFYGKAGNDANKPMYVTLVDSDTPVHSKKVLYSAYGDMNNIREPEWHEWNIPLGDFTGVNLTKVKTIVIGFGDKTKAATNGTVWFENIVLWTTRCILAERDADFARVDYAPLGSPCGDCKVDDKELEMISNDWLMPPQATKAGEIKVEIHIVKGSGITEEQIREQIKKANEVDDPNAKFVVTSVHIYEPNTPYDANCNEKCKVNIWGLKKNPWDKRFPDKVDPNVSAQWGKVVILVPGDGNNTLIQPSTGAHELNHFLGLDHNDVNNNPITDPNNKMYPDNDWEPNGVLKSGHRKGTKLEEWQRKKMEKGAKKCQKGSDAVLSGYGDETYDNVGDVSFEYIDLNWMLGWMEWIQDMYVLHLTAQVDLLSFENYSEIGFYIESDSNQSTGQPPEGLDYYVALQPSYNQIKFERYDTHWIPLDTNGISFEFAYINPDVNLPPIPSGVKFELPLTLLQRRAGDVISYKAAAQNYVEIDVSPNAGLLSIAFPPPLIPPDIDGDGTVNFKDFAILANQWLKEELWP